MSSHLLDDSTIVIFFVAIILIIIGVYFYNSIMYGNRNKREKQAMQYARKTKSVIKPYFSKFINDCGGMECFSDMLNPSFCNVIEKLDKENGDVYIGELRWEIAVEQHKRRRRSLVADLMFGSEKKYIRVPKEATLCVLYDDGFNLPNFDLIRETLKDKAVEVLGMNKTEDIDFDEDKEFSSSWWLSSNENMIVRDLFTKNIRSNFMNFVDKGYRICGRKNVLFILANKAFWPEDYSRVISDIRMIQRFMKNNKKFYTPYSERQEEGKEESQEQLS